MNARAAQAAVVVFAIACILGFAIFYRNNDNSPKNSLRLEYGSGESTVYLGNDAVVRLVSRSANVFSIEMPGDGIETVKVTFEKGNAQPTQVHRVIEEGGIAYLITYNDRGEIDRKVSLQEPLPSGKN
jgi:hypothetical protein